jgi:carboxymethylenebutenolidase
MCDEHSLADMIESVRSAEGLSRRSFGALAASAGMAMTLPRVVGAVTVTESDVEIKTPDGVADCHFVHPATGASAAVLVWPDAGGLRPAFKQMGRRLAESGYAVLTPNPFYRTRRASEPAPAPTPAAVQNEAARTAIVANTRALSPATHVTDAAALVAWLDSQSTVDKRRKIGTTGYCMGGPIVMRTAATIPDRIGAGATFHGGGLASDSAESPHLLIPKMKASFLIAIAANDDERDPKAKDTLRQAFVAAKLPATVEVYVGTKHGWCPPGGAVYDEAQAEKAWTQMLELFKRTLA